jgi:hypothetical protein
VAAARLAAGAEALATATDYILSREDRRDALTGATTYLRLAGDVFGGALLLRGALASPDPAHDALLVFHAETVLAAAPFALPAIRLGAATGADIASSE